MDVIAQAERQNITTTDDRYIPLAHVYPQDTPLESLSTATKRITNTVLEVTQAMQGDSYTKIEKYKIANVTIDTVMEGKLNTSKLEHQDQKGEEHAHLNEHDDVPAHVHNISDDDECIL